MRHATRRSTAAGLAMAVAATVTVGCGADVDYGSAGSGAPGGEPEAATAAPESERTGSTEAAGPQTPPTRVALPGLFTIMAGLERDLAGVSRGVWRVEADTIAAHAGAVADHPTIPPSEVERIAGVLGPDMARFKELDTEVHDLALRIRELATRDALDPGAILEADAALRRGCVTCHTEFRERLREEIR